MPKRQPEPAAGPAFPEPQHYRPEDLISHAREIAGVNPEIARAALSEVTRHELTLSDFRRAVDAFLKRRVR